MSPASLVMTMADDAASREQFTRLLAAHGPGLRRVARAYAGSQGDEADLAQDIAIAIWRSLPAFRGECSERTFAYRIAHNRGISYAESSRVRERATPLVDPPVAVDTSPAADEALDAARRRDALFHAIGALPVAFRTVITLALEGMTHDEIADIVGTSANNVAVRLTRARAELRAKLGGVR
jgi:RNA polymerase sigma factor (sigma-70 family)